jgi:hypothetical protein
MQVPSGDHAKAVTPVGVLKQVEHLFAGGPFPDVGTALAVPGEDLGAVRRPGQRVDRAVMPGQSDARSLDGTHQTVSRKHLNLYVQEFVFQYNHLREPIVPLPIALAAAPVR